MTLHKHHKVCTELMQILIIHGWLAEFDIFTALKESDQTAEDERTADKMAAIVVEHLPLYIFYLSSLFIFSLSFSL